MAVSFAASFLLLEQFSQEVSSLKQNLLCNHPPLMLHLLLMEVTHATSLKR
jgi:hypothetical protein